MINDNYEYKRLGNIYMTQELYYTGHSGNCLLRREIWQNTESINNQHWTHNVKSVLESLCTDLYKLLD